MHLKPPVFRPNVLNGCAAFEFDGTCVLKTRPFAQPLPQPITLIVVAKARGDTTIIDALGPSSSRFELCHGYPTGWHPSPEICITASGHDAPPQRSLRGSTRGTGEWHIYTAVFDARRSELFRSLVQLDFSPDRANAFIDNPEVWELRPIRFVGYDEKLYAALKAANGY